MNISVVVVNYRSASLIIDALNSLYRETKGVTFEVIVVDNDSGDDSQEKITICFPAVRWIRMEYNAGFARANNAGIRASTGETILLLNPDTLILEDALSRAHVKLKESGYAACGVQLLNPDGSPQISGSFFMKGGLNHLLPLPYWGDFLRWLGYRTKTKVPNVLEASTNEEVDWISGAFLMVKREAITCAGLMDEDFFLYGEEVEWCSRLRKAGKLVIFGDVHIIHLQGEAVLQEHGSSAKGYKGLFTRKDFQVMLSNHLRVRKQFGVGWFFFLLLNYTFAVPVYFVCSFVHRLFTGRNPIGEWGQAGKFAFNVARLWRWLPTIVRGKPHFYKVI